MEQLSPTDADLAQRLNAYELKRELLRTEINSPPEGFTLDWLADRVLEAKRLTLFIDTLKGVLKA